MMIASLCLLSIDAHPALIACIGAGAFVLLMLHDPEPLNFLMTVDARHHDVGACCLMQVDVLPQSFCFAFCKCLTLDWLVLADLFLYLSFLIAKCFEAP